MDLQRLCRQISCSESRRSKAGKQPSPVVPEILLLVQGRRPPGPYAVRNGTRPDTDVWLCPTLQNRQHKAGGKSKDLVAPMRDSARQCAQCVARDARRASPWRETTHRDCPILAGQLSVSRPILSTATHQYVGRTQDATPSKLAGREWERGRKRSPYAVVWWRGGAYGKSSVTAGVSAIREGCDVAIVSLRWCYCTLP